MKAPHARRATQAEAAALKAKYCGTQPGLCMELGDVAIMVRLLDGQVFATTEKDAKRLEAGEGSPNCGLYDGDWLPEAEP